MDAHAAVRTFYGFFHNDRNICNLMLDDFDGGKQASEFFGKYKAIHVKSRIY